jgi:hypothetical protein
MRHSIQTELMSFKPIKVEFKYRKPPNSGPGTLTQPSLNNPVILGEISYNVLIFRLFTVPGLYAKLSRTFHIMSHQFITYY